MNTTPNATKYKFTYENIIAKCPTCGTENTYNRSTDLNAFTKFDIKKVKCQDTNCNQDFNITSDIVNPAYDLLIIDCYDLIQAKKYQYCILNLTQSFEMFFALFLRVELLYKPFAKSNSFNYDEINSMQIILDKKIKGFAFSKMRAIFLNYIIFSKLILNRDIQSLQESKLIIEQLSSNDVSKDNLILLNNTKLSNLLESLIDSNIGNKRNEVVHKVGYRPSKDEAELFMKETQQIIYGLASIFGPLTDNIDFYR